MERTQIRQRIKSGYDNYRNTGGRVGRKKGFIKTDEQLLEEHQDVVKLLKKGLSIRNIMKITDKSSGRFRRLRRYNQINQFRLIQKFE